MSLGVVMLVMRELGSPENAARVGELFAGGTVDNSGNKSGVQNSASPKTPPDSFQLADPGRAATSQPQASSSKPVAPDLKQVLTLSEWTPERFAQFVDNEPLTEAESDELVQLLWRVRTFDAASIEAWANDGTTFRQISDDPAAQRGEMVHFTGQAVKFERHELPAEQAARVEMPAYYTCNVEVDGGNQSVVITPQLPRRWTQIKPLSEPVTVSGLFVKQLSGSDDETGQNKPAKLFVAKRVAWHPTTPREPAVSLGMSVLGSLGMDVGLLDQIRSHGPLHRGDTAAFYEMLGAAGRIGANQLIRFANGNLDVVRRQWEQEASTASDEMRRELGNEVVRLANEGRYSFALLYNDAKRQIGQLVVFDGTARRVVRIDVGSRDEDGAPSAVARRFGIDHYYELHVFTDDSQNYPLVCCMRELPTGLPTGDDLHVPVRVAGFFFKDWLYTTRGTRDLDTGELDLQNGKRQHAPLLVGRAPVLLQLEEKSGAGQLVGGGLFLLALGGIWAAAWWLSRQDRRVAERRRTAVHSLPPGQSLNDLTIPPADEPVSVEGEVRTEDDRRT